MDVKEVIKLLKLEPLQPEGGFFRQTYKATTTIPGKALPEHGGDRSVATAIYYLVTPDRFSTLHIVKSDEVFHFYMGDPVEMVQIDPSGKAQHIIIGTDLKAGQSPQVVVPADTWQGTRLLKGGKWALIGCTVSPGFEYADFASKTRAELFKMFPNLKDYVVRFTYE